VRGGQVVDVAGAVLDLLDLQRAGTCQKSMGNSTRSDWLGERRDDDGTRRHALDDHDSAVPGDGLVGPRRERLGPAPYWEQHLARPVKQSFVGGIGAVPATHPAEMIRTA
jgi:hypothetical protein